MRNKREEKEKQKKETQDGKRGKRKQREDGEEEATSRDQHACPSGADEPAVGHLGHVLLGVIYVLAIVPVPGREGVAINGDLAGPGRATTWQKVSEE